MKISFVTIFILISLITIKDNILAQPIQMTKDGGVYMVPCKVNGLTLSFILDTGASNVMLSLTEALFMIKNGYLKDSDFRESEKYIIANGQIAEGTKVILRNVQIGDFIIRDVEASIMHNIDAPLLFGLSALERFGRVEFDYTNSILNLRPNQNAEPQIHSSNYGQPINESSIGSESVNTNDYKKAQKYFNQAVKAYQDKKNFKRAFKLVEKALTFIPNDTAVLMNAGVFFGPAAKKWDKSIDYINQYHKKGGSNSDSYIVLFSIYRDKKGDFDKALTISQTLVRKFPNNSEFPRYELDMYIKMNRLPEAKKLLLEQAYAEPYNKEIRYFLGIISFEMEDNVEGRKWYEEAIRLDSKYFEPQLGLAEVVYLEAKDIKDQMNQLGNSKEDFQKKVALDKTYQDKLKVALPYWEKCEKLSPDEGKVLDVLYMIYSDLEMTAQVTRVEKRMKTLGLLD